MIGLLIFAAFLLMAGVAVALFDSKSEGRITVVFSFPLILLASIVMGGFFYHDGYKTGQIDALEGNYRYEKSIEYRVRDSVLTPVDSTFVKIKN